VPSRARTELGRQVDLVRAIAASTVMVNNGSGAKTHTSGAASAPGTAVIAFCRGDEGGSATGGD
jgi:hypothetical protein